MAAFAWRLANRSFTSLAASSGILSRRPPFKTGTTRTRSLSISSNIRGELDQVAVQEQVGQKLGLIRRRSP